MITFSCWAEDVQSCAAALLPKWCPTYKHHVSIVTQRSLILFHSKYRKPCRSVTKLGFVLSFVTYPSSGAESKIKHSNSASHALASLDGHNVSCSGPVFN